MMIAHIGLDGSGKSYGMAQDAIRALKKKRHEVWSLFPVAGVGRIRHPHQVIFLEKSIVFLDELQRFFPPSHAALDEITMHIVSTHRHDKNILHWSAQDWMYVHPHIRYQTSMVWLYEPIHRNPLTGESNWYGTGLHRHVRYLVAGPQVERGLRHPDIMKKQYFWITKKGIAVYNSFGKIPVHVSDEITSEYIANLVDPHYENSAAPDALIAPDGEMPEEHGELVAQEKDYGLTKNVERKDQADDGDAIAHVLDPRESCRRER